MLIWHTSCNLFGTLFGSPFGILFGSPFGTPFYSPFGTPFCSPLGTPFSSPFGTPLRRLLGTLFCRPLGASLLQSVWHAVFRPVAYTPALAFDVSHHSLLAFLWGTIKDARQGEGRVQGRPASKARYQRCRPKYEALICFCRRPLITAGGKLNIGRWYNWRLYSPAKSGGLTFLPLGGYNSQRIQMGVRYLHFL